jgi:hypothetical protein
LPNMPGPASACVPFPLGRCHFKLSRISSRIPDGPDGGISSSPRSTHRRFHTALRRFSQHAPDLSEFAQHLSLLPPSPSWHGILRCQNLPNATRGQYIQLSRELSQSIYTSFHIVSLGNIVLPRAPGPYSIPILYPWYLDSIRVLSTWSISYPSFLNVATHRTLVLYPFACIVLPSYPP